MEWVLAAHLYPYIQQIKDSDFHGAKLLNSTNDTLRVSLYLNIN